MIMVTQVTRTREKEFANKRRRKALNKGKTKIAGGEKCKIKVKLK